jgi:hypothetical protein
MDNCEVCAGYREKVRTGLATSAEVCADCDHLYIPGEDDCACGEHGEEAEED